MKIVYGFNEIKKNIIDSFISGKLHHCNLINGIKGTGKASFIYNEIIPFILSETNSINKETIVNSVVDRTVKLIESGGHSDLLVLDINTTDEDGKENTSKKGEINVNQARKIINNIKLTPSISKNKVLIIDSIDNLNINAQNALLKTLEEPPQNTFLFLICHNLNKVLTTIKSRSNIINCQQLSIEDWGSALFSNEEIQEVEIEDEELSDLYTISNASVGFAMNILHNSALDLYDRILEILLNKDIVKIQKFANDFAEQEKFDLMCVFFERVLMDLANYGVVIGNSIFIERRKEIFELIKKRNDVNKLLGYCDYFLSTIKDVEVYNLDKKQAICVVVNEIRL